MNTKVTLALLAGCLLSAPTASRLAANDAPDPVSPQILDTYQYYDDFGSGGWLGLVTKVPANRIIELQGSLDLDTWHPLTEPIFALRETMELHAPLGDAFEKMFVRVQAVPLPARLHFAPDEIVLEVSSSLEWHLLLPFLEREAGEELFFIDPERGLPPPVAPGTYRASTVDGLLKELEVPFWTPAAHRDDPALADRFPDDPREQAGLLPDDEPGRGLMEEPWDGDGIVFRPEEAPEDPPPVRDPDMPLVIEIPDLPPGTGPELAPNYRDPGKHVRLGMELGRDGSFEATFAYEVDGDALLNEPFPVPATGAVVWVVRSPAGAPDAAEHIYYIGVRSDAFVERAYEPDGRGAHGSWLDEAGFIRVPVPVPTLRGIEPIYDGLELEVYQLVTEVEGDFLTPDVFLRNPDSFHLRAVMDASDVHAALQRTQRENANLAEPQGHGNSALTLLHYSGPRSKKFNFVIIGDGFTNTSIDQGLFNDYVDNVVMSDLLQRDIHPEILNAINIFRINAFSVESGITTVDAAGTVIGNERNTALRYRYSGIWSRCWMERAPTQLLPNFQVLLGTEALINQYVNHHVPEADVIAVVLNTTAQGGCARASHFVVTRRPDGWGTFAHEFGHYFGNLGDEYQCNQGESGCGQYTAATPSVPNLDNTTSRNNLKWKQWVPSYRPLPTALANVADEQRDVGAFAGATIGSNQWWNGIFRPSWRGRMNDNTPIHNPVGYTRVRDNARPRQDADFRKSVVGDFNGDGKTDLYVANLTDWDQPYLCMLKSFGDRFEPVRIYAGKLPGWQMRPGDQFFAADFNGNGRADLYVYNGTAWAIPYFLMLRSTGTSLQYVRRYDQFLPNWEMGKNEKIHVGDFTGNGRSDIAVIDTHSWNQVHLRVYASTGSSLSLRDRYYGWIGNFWQMNRHDRLYALDFDGDGSTDLAIFNGFSWSRVYLGMLRVVEGKIVPQKLYNNVTANVPGWLMGRHDQYWVADVNGNGRQDLVVFNGPSWSTNYLGIMRSMGAGNLHATWQASPLDGWNFTNSERFHVADFRGTGGWEDLFVFNKNWFGLLRSHSNHFKLEAAYPKWIHNHRWHSSGWW